MPTQGRLADLTLARSKNWHRLVALPAPPSRAQAGQAFDAILVSNNHSTSVSLHR